MNLTTWLEDRSLRRGAARRRRELSHRGRLERVVENARTRPDLLLLALGAAIFLSARLYIPGPLPPGLADPKSASDFLRTLWQVEASVLAITYAVVVFALQSFSSTHRDVSLGGLIRGSRLDLALYAGLYSLLLAPAALLGWGDGAPGGFAAVWATICSSTLALASLVYAFQQTLRSTDERALQNFRLQRFQTSVADYVDTQVLERIALGRLREDCEAIGVRFSPHIAKDSVGGFVTADKPGIVRDINIRALRRVALECPGLTIGAYIGQPVAPDSKILLAPGSLGASARRIVSIRGSRLGDPLTDAAGDLHDVALEAIRTRRVDSFELVQEAWQRVLVAFPREWARYGQPYDGQLDAPLSILGRSHLDSVMQHLYEEAVAVIDQGSRELAFSLTTVPAYVTREALHLGSASLVGRMLRWLVILHFLAFDKPGEVNKLLTDRAIRLLFDLCRFVIWPELEQARRAEDIETPLASALTASHASYELLRGLADGSALQELIELDRRWSHVGSLWTPAHAEPSEVTMLLARRDLPEGSSELSELEASYQARQIQLDAQKRLTHVEHVLRFGLCFWAIHRLAQGKDRLHWAAVFHHFAGTFHRADVLVETVGNALDSENRGALDWSSWLMEEQPEDEVHTFAPSVDIIRAAVAILIDRPMPLPPAPWIRDYKDQWEGYLQFARREPDHLNPLVDHAVMEARIEAASGHLSTALREQIDKDAAEVRRLPLSQATTDKITALARAGWERSRWMPAILRAYSSYEETIVPGNVARPFGRAEWLPKEWFVNAGIEMSWEGFVRDYGQSIASAEVAVVLDALSSAPVVSRQLGETVADAVARAVDEIRGNQYRAHILFIPLDHELQQQLGVGLTARGRPSPPSDWQLPIDSRSVYLGVIDHVHVLAVPRRLEGLAYLLDLEAWGTWHQTCIASPVAHCLQVTVGVYDHTQSRTMARENKNLMRTKTRRTIADRAKAVHESIELRVQEYFSIEVKEPNAARKIKL